MNWLTGPLFALLAVPSGVALAAGGAGGEVGNRPSNSSSVQILQPVSAFFLGEGEGGSARSDNPKERDMLDQTRKRQPCASQFWDSLAEAGQDPEVKKALKKIGDGLDASKIRLNGLYVQTMTGNAQPHVEVELYEKNKRRELESEDFAWSKFSLNLSMPLVERGADQKKINCSVNRQQLAQEIHTIPKRAVAQLTRFIEQMNKRGPDRSFASEDEFKKYMAEEKKTLKMFEALARTLAPSQPGAEVSNLQGKRMTHPSGTSPAKSDESSAVKMGSFE